MDAVNSICVFCVFHLCNSLRAGLNFSMLFSRMCGDDRVITARIDDRFIGLAYFSREIYFGFGRNGGEMVVLPGMRAN